MFFIVFNINTNEFYYRNYLMKGYLDVNFQRIVSLIKQGEFTFNEEQHQLAFVLNRDVVFGAIRPCEGAKISRDDNIWNKKIELKVIHNIVKRFSKLLTDQEINELKGKNYETNKKIFDHRIKEHFYPQLTQIYLFGNQNAGLSSIMYFWLGFTSTTSSINSHIPIDKAFYNSNIVFIRPKIGSFAFRLKDLVSRKSNIIYIIDSTENVNSITQNNNIKILRTGEGKVLIIANKQDLPGANSPDIIEKIIGIPTVGFSAIDPNAPRHLEKIISDFLNN